MTFPFVVAQLVIYIRLCVFFTCGVCGCVHPVHCLFWNVSFTTYVARSTCIDAGTSSCYILLCSHFIIPQTSSGVLYICGITEHVQKRNVHRTSFPTYTWIIACIRCSEHRKGYSVTDCRCGLTRIHHSLPWLCDQCFYYNSSKSIYTLEEKIVILQNYLFMLFFLHLAHPDCE